MATQQPIWSRSSWTDAGQLIELIDPERRPVKLTGQAPHAWFADLVSAGKYSDALSFVAHALPRYECVTWSAQALIDIGAVDRREPLMVAILRWIDEPSDQLRRAAGELGDNTREDTPSRMLALAVMFSGGSIAPADMPPVQPPTDVCAKFAHAAVLKGALARPDRVTAQRRALELGEAMARGS